MAKLTEINWTHLSNEELKLLKKQLNEEYYQHILDALNQVKSEESAIIYRLLSKDKAITIFNMLESTKQKKLLYALANHQVEELIGQLPPDDRVRLLDEMPAKVVNHLLNTLSEQEHQKTALLMGYKEETAGRLMTPNYLSVKKGETVEEALAKVKKKGENLETIYVIYVMNSFRKLEGVLSLKELVLAPSHLTIEAIMKTQVEYVTTETDQEDVAKKLRELDVLALPVVDTEHRLVGMVTVDDAMDVLVEETTEDIFNKAGLAELNHKESDRSNRLINGSLLSIWKVRLPFLFITMIGGLLAGVVIGQFEESLESVAAVAIFIPIIMDMGGNAGTQSSTIFSRGLILGDINTERFMKYLGKECLVGLTMGTLIGILTGIVAFVWQDLPALGLAVGIALVLTMTLATTIGFLIPYILYKCGIDQAAGADPIITTIKDITGLIIYFVLVNHLLTSLL